MIVLGPAPSRPGRPSRPAKRIRPPGGVVRKPTSNCRAIRGRCVPSSSAPWIETWPGCGGTFAEFDGHPVLARQGRFLVASFHPGTDRRHAASRDVLEGGFACQGIASGRRSKHKRSAADAKRGKLFTKLARSIIGRQGGRERSGQQRRAQNAVDKARSQRSNAEGQHRRAIAKGARRGADAARRTRRVITGATARRASPPCSSRR